MPTPGNLSSLGEARHPYAVSIQTVAEVEVFYLYLMLTCCRARNDVLMLTDGGEDESSSILHNTYATLIVSISFSLWAGLRGVGAPPGPFLYPTALLYSIVLYLSIDCGNIL